MSLTRLLDYLPRGNLLDDVAWRKRHKSLLWVLFVHIPTFLVFGLWLGYSVVNVGLFVLAVPMACLLLGMVVPHRRVASFFVTAGLVYCSSALVGLTNGNIEAHFHFFVIIGFIALYQDWVPFLWNIVFMVFSHGIGTAWQADLIFNHLPAQTNPWVWSLIHGIAVLFACVGVVIFWRTTEDEQQKAIALSTQLAAVELNQRKFTSELLVNLARRNQSMLYRQLDIINQLEEKERDPDALGELFQLDHLATRIRRNAESLLVLSGEEPTRVWSEPVRLIDVVRAAIAETEDLDRVVFAVDERVEVLGHTVTDLTHALAELTENAVRYSPPEANVTIRTRPYLRIPGAAVLTVEDWGVGMRPDDMAAANELLARPRDVDFSMSQRLGLHVVARLAARHHIQASLTPTPGTGVTAVVVLPADLFASNQRRPAPDEFVRVDARPPVAAPVPTGRATQPTPPIPRSGIPTPRRSTSNGQAHGSNGRGLHARPEHEDARDWTGWWTPTRQSTGQESAPVSTVPSAAAVARAAPRSAESTGSSATGSSATGSSGAVTTDHDPVIGTASEQGPHALLTRRIPQAHLAPELRRSPSSDGDRTESSSGTESSTESPSDGPHSSAAPDAQQAREALSRFQASRQAAQQQVDADETRSPNGTGPES
ncbi:MAG: sensor histidine kinase [Pseudonocardiales bacterium]